MLVKRTALTALACLLAPSAWATPGARDMVGLGDELTLLMSAAALVGVLQLVNLAVAFVSHRNPTRGRVSFSRLSNGLNSVLAAIGIAAVVVLLVVMAALGSSDEVTTVAAIGIPAILLILGLQVGGWIFWRRANRALNGDESTS